MPSFIDLEELFRSRLSPTPLPDRDRFSAIPIPSLESHRLAKNHEGAPCLLLSQRPDVRVLAPSILQNISVSYQVPCNVQHVDGTQENGRFTIFGCSAADAELFPHFLRVLSPFVMALGPSPTAAELNRAISSLIELFRVLTTPGKRTIQGLWSELFVILNSISPIELLAAWHGVPEERFDFAVRAQRIEVKSSSSRRRVHHFALDQLHSGRNQIVVASIFTERISGGTSLRNLFDQARGLIAGNLQLAMQFDATFYSSLGSTYAEGMKEAFDWELARESVAFYRAQEVPTPARPIPASVSDVRFCSDLSSSTPINNDELRILGGIFAAVVPQ